MFTLKRIVHLIAALAVTAACALALSSCDVRFSPACRHEWAAPTCTAPATCTKCGETDGEALGHTGGSATCIAPATCEVCGDSYGETAPHGWSEATCILPKTCNVCSATEGEPLGHKGGSATCTALAICDVCGNPYGETAPHGWSDATCTEPKTCGVCSATEGEPLGHKGGSATCTSRAICETCGKEYGDEPSHDWSEATCLVPKTCGVCSATEGTTVNHSWKDPTCDAAATCKWCELTDGEPAGHDYDYATGKCRDCDDTVDVVLYTDSSNMMAESSSQAVVFYAEIKMEGGAGTVKLYDSKGNLLATMRDDGDYQNSKDEFSNDGVYTCQIYVDTTAGSDVGYYVTLGDTSVKSNVHSIKWVEQMTDEEIGRMESVDTQLSEVVGGDSLAGKTEAEKKAIVEKAIETLESSTLIVSDSVVFDEGTGTFTFVYESGVLGAISLNDWKDTSAPEFPGVSDEVADKFTGVDVMILWSFDQATDDPTVRYPFYTELVADWTAKGLDTAFDDDVTVADYKNLTGYEIIMISSHGAYYEYKVGNARTKRIPGIILSEEVTREKDALYANDLRMQRVAKFTCSGGTKYVILPAFWEYYYQDGLLDGSFVVSESCEFFGVDGHEDNSMANAIMSTSAEGVLGFRNSVMMIYSRNLITAFVEALVDGMSAEDALALAKAQCGESDSFEGRELYGPAAYPIYIGNDSYLVNMELENGSFEESPDLLGWTAEGDVRVLTKLGALLSVGGTKMAILTTGVGSGTSDYVGSNGGSVLQQSFIVNDSVTSLSFSYNVVSEEPMEYVGSSYDDKMYAELVDAAGNVTRLCYESINTSKWSSVSGINFEGGDTSCYQTGWINVTFDLTQYRGQTVTVRFVVYDVGDSQYDTAALIDDVKLN